MAQRNEFLWYLYSHSPPFARNWVVSRYSSKRGRVKFGARFHETLVDLTRTQWYENARLQQLQDEKLRRLAHYVVEFVPYYRDLFDRLELKASEIEGVSDLARLPVLEKSDVQDAGHDLFSNLFHDKAAYEDFLTSGTTGKPVLIRVSAEALQMEKAFTWLHRRWGGIEVGDITAAFVGFPLVPTRQSKPPFWVHDKSENRVMYSLQHLSRKNMRFYAESLARVAPRMIYGYPTAIFLVAQHLNDMGIRNIRPRAIFTASETLLDHQRAEIEQAFGCHILDWYGANELVANIVQCERGLYHVKQEYGVVEVLKRDGTPAGPGEKGDLIGTGLNNLAMPLFRYRVGDTIVPKAGVCDCGRGGPLVEQITGRVEDVIVTPDGRWLTRLDFIFKGLDFVEEAQLVQEERAELRVRVVRKEGFHVGIEQAITANLREMLGDEIRLVFEYMDQIPRTKSGKFRFVISKVELESKDPRQAGEVAGLVAEDDQTL